MSFDIADECWEEYEQLKHTKSSKYIIYGLDSRLDKIIVLKTSTSNEYNDFIADLPETECRWAVYDFEYEGSDTGKRNKLLFITWSPDAAKIKQKMIYASSKSVLRRALEGIAVDINGADYSEVTYENVLEASQRGRD